MCGVFPTLQCINRDDVSRSITQNSLTDLGKAAQPARGEVIENLAAYFANMAGCDFLDLLLACGAGGDALTAVFSTEGTADVSILLQTRHDS